MKVKTASEIKRFQEDKELGSWFNKLFPVIAAMPSCQPEQAIEPGQNNTLMDENDSRLAVETTPTSSSSSSSTDSKKHKYVPTPCSSRKSKKGSIESVINELSTSIKELKQLVANDASKDILSFLKEESERQASRD